MALVSNIYPTKKGSRFTGFTSNRVESSTDDIAWKKANNNNLYYPLLQLIKYVLSLFLKLFTMRQLTISFGNLFQELIIM